MPAIFQFDNYKSLTLYQNACSYHFYLIYFFCNSFIYNKGSYIYLYILDLLWKNDEFVDFIIIGYNILKLFFWKVGIFCVFFFNPMLIQQEMSFSSDSLINTICLLAIAYFLKMKFNSDKIETIDIIIVFTMMVLFLAKYIYLPIFGIYFYYLIN